MTSMAAATQFEKAGASEQIFAATVEAPTEKKFDWDNTFELSESNGTRRQNGQRPPGKIDEDHIREAEIVALKPNLSIHEMMKYHKVILFHKTSAGGYNLYDHLKNGGVDFAHFDLD